MLIPFLLDVTSHHLTSAREFRKQRLVICRIKEPARSMYLDFLQSNLLICLSVHGKDNSSFFHVIITRRVWCRAGAWCGRFTRKCLPCWPYRCAWINACVKGHLEPTHLKSSPLFTFSTKSLGQDSPSVHLFSKTIGSRLTTAKIKLGEDSPSWFIHFRSRFTLK